MRVAVYLIAAGAVHAAAPPPVNVQFADVTTQAGIKFRHNAGKQGKKYLPETLGAGCAFIDYNNDDWPDIVFANGRDWTPGPRRTTPALYRNNKNGTFTDVTAEAGLAIQMHGMGIAAGDFDNDGWADLYLTALEGDKLLRNLGNGKFGDVTAASGIANANFATSAAWLDYDRDGKIDLFVANYVQWNQKGDLWCSLDGATKSYCTPESYKGLSSKLYRNLGGGKFEDASRKAGIADGTSKSLGIGILDMDNNGWPDIFVANDTQPNKLWKNNGNGTFTDVAVAAGVAFGEDGTARGAMGVDSADYDRSGRAHLLVGNFSNQMLGLYHNEGSGLFVDEAPANNVGRISLLYLAFGVFFFDYDNDGMLDIFTANGHIEEEISRVQPRVKYSQNPLIFRNLGGRKFEHVNAKVGAAINRAIVARGAAYADYDRDGDLDVLISTNNGPAYLYRNDGGNQNTWIRFKTAGKKSNRDGYGAVVRVKSAGGQQWSTVRSGSSYCSQSERALTFGLGKDRKVDAVEVIWPSGEKQQFAGLDSNKSYVLEEGAKAAVALP